MKANIQVFDARSAGLVRAGAELEVLHDGCTFTEGPVWFGDLQCLLWSDIPNNKLLRWTPDGHVSVFRADSRNTNGNTRDRQGRLLSAEHSGRRVSRTELDGSITVIADSYEGKKLNSPNDVVVKSDGSIWFTDPEYGLWMSFPGEKRQQATENVYRVDPATGAVTAVVTDFDKPNGLAFSPDEKFLYVADSAVSNNPNGNSHIRRFEVRDDGTLAGGEVFATTVGIPDGLRLDTDANIWTSAGKGVNVYAPSGAFLLRIDGFPHDVTNLTFGGVGKDQIFITAGTSVYALRVNARGVQWP